MQISEIMEQIIIECERHGAKEAFLFGSRAKGTARPRSDFDIAVAGVSDIEGLIFWFNIMPLQALSQVRREKCCVLPFKQT